LLSDAGRPVSRRGKKEQFLVKKKGGTENRDSFEGMLVVRRQLARGGRGPRKHSKYASGCSGANRVEKTGQEGEAEERFRDWRRLRGFWVTQGDVRDCQLFTFRETRQKTGGGGCNILTGLVWG